MVFLLFLSSNRVYIRLFGKSSPDLCILQMSLVYRNIYRREAA